MAQGERGGRALRVAALAAALALGVIFVWLGAKKALDPARFAREAKAYKLLPAALVAPWAILLPWWELAAGLALFLPRWRRAGAALVFLLSAAFTVAVASVLARRLEGVACGCGFEGTLDGWHLAFVAVLAAAAGWVWKVSGLGPDDGRQTTDDGNYPRTDDG